MFQIFIMEGPQLEPNFFNSMQTNYYGNFLGGSLNKMRMSLQLCDVTIILLDGSRHRAHKLVLFGSSERFRSVIASNEEVSVLKLEFQRADIFLHVLQYMYTGEFAGVSSENIPAFGEMCTALGIYSFKSLGSYYHYSNHVNMGSNTEFGRISVAETAVTPHVNSNGSHQNAVGMERPTRNSLPSTECNSGDSGLGPEMHEERKKRNLRSDQTRCNVGALDTFIFQDSALYNEIIRERKVYLDNIRDPHAGLSFILPPTFACKELRRLSILLSSFEVLYFGYSVKSVARKFQMAPSFIDKMIKSCEDIMASHGRLLSEFVQQTQHPQSESLTLKSIFFHSKISDIIPYKTFIDGHFCKHF